MHNLHGYLSRCNTKGRSPLFVFLNVGETHVPYWHEDANWEQWPNPCIPFEENDALVKKVEDVRLRLSGLTLRFLLIGLQKLYHPCRADHGDCWGEDGLWEHELAILQRLLYRY